MVIWCGPKQATRCVVSGVSWEGRGCKLTVCDSSGLLGRSYTVICDWELSVLGSDVPGRGSAGNRGQFLLVLDLGLLKKRYGAC